MRAYRRGKSLHELCPTWPQYETVRQSACWDLFLREEWNSPDRGDFYTMDNTLAIRELQSLIVQLFGGSSSRNLDVNHMKLRFDAAPKVPEKPETPEEATVRLLKRRPHHFKKWQEEQKKRGVEGAEG